MPRPRRNSSNPTSPSRCSARSTVFFFTPSTAARSLASGSRSPGPQVAWVDYNGSLHIGSLVTGHQRVAAVAPSDPVVPLIAAGDHLYWVNTGGTYWQIQSLDLATGRITNLGFGMAVFASADGLQVFIAQTGERLLEFAAAGGRSRSLNLPAGWFVAGLSDDFTSPAAVSVRVLVPAH